MPALSGKPGIEVEVRDLGRMDYRSAYEAQIEAHERVLGWRAQGGPMGVVLVVEHDPVVTAPRRVAMGENLLATPELLAREGVEVVETDRGGDITYHGPGQIVVYPIVDLNRLGIRLHAYLRALEGAAMRVCGSLGLEAVRDEGATGVWIPPRDGSPFDRAAKVCAIGVRVRKWVTLHGMALNVRTNLDHFGLIVPCGLQGRPVTSLENELGEACPDTARVQELLVESLKLELAGAVATDRK